MFFHEREVLVRQEQYRDRRREAAAYRLWKQLPQRRRAFGFMTPLATWLGNRTVRFGYFLGADIRAVSITRERVKFI